MIFDYLYDKEKFSSVSFKKEEMLFVKFCLHGNASEKRLPPGPYTEYGKLVYSLFVAFGTKTSDEVMTFE